MLYPIHPRNSTGKDSHAFWEEFLTNDQINYLLSRPEWINNEEAKVGGTSEGVVNKNIRKTNVGWMYADNNNKEIWATFSELISSINSQFFKFDLTGFYEPAQLTIYKENDAGHYSWHTDYSPKDSKIPRKLSMSLLLSDPSEFEGGELQIKTENDEPITLPQQRGRAWFFPSYVLHQVTPVTRGVRRSLVLWIGGPEFK